jgi:hypothetical protein
LGKKGSLSTWVATAVSARDNAQWDAVLTRPGSVGQRARPRSAAVTIRSQGGGDLGWARRNLYAVRPLVEC